MMDGTEFLFEEDTRVRLKDIDLGFYGELACVGNEGWVRKNDRDKFGLPKVYVEWDKNHWTYNGVPDGWTFQDHFELAEVEKVSDPKIDAFARLMGEFAQRFTELNAEKSAPEPQPAPTEPVVTATASDDEFAQGVASIVREMQGAQAIVVLGVTREDHPNVPKGLLRPFVYKLARTPEAELVTDAQMARVAAESYFDLVVHHISTGPSE